MKRLLPLLLALLLAAPAFALSEEEAVLNIFTWAEYISPSVLEPFTAETGIQINYSFFDSNEEMLTKLQAEGGGTYDIVLASDYIVDISRREGLMQPLDKAKIANWNNIDPRYRGQYFDPDDQYVIPYIAGTPLIMYDPARVDIEITGYESLWDESLRESLVLMDDGRNIIGITLKSMGESFNTTDPEILARAEEKLMKLQPNVRVLDYDRPDLPLVSGEATVGYLFTPAIIWAQEERPDLQVVYPAEGMGFGIDALFVPVNAPHPDNAHLFLDFLLKPDIGLSIALEQAYTCVNQEAYKLLPQEIKDNPALYIPAEIIGQPEYIMDVGDAEPIFTEIWTKFQQF